MVGMSGISTLKLATASILARVDLHETLSLLGVQCYGTVQLLNKAGWDKIPVVLTPVLNLALDCTSVFHFRDNLEDFFLVDLLFQLAFDGFQRSIWEKRC